MRIFKSYPPALLVAAVAATTSAAADLVRFNDNQTRLSGEVTAIHQDGSIELKSPLTTSPLKLNGKEGMFAEFSHSGSPPPTPPATVTLVNKDVLPAFRMNGMKDGCLVIDSPVGQDIRIPRDAIVSAQFGIAPPRTIFGENDQLSDWFDEMKERENWEIQSDSLVARGRASTSHQLDLPDDFTIRFKLEWQENQGPDMQVHLCSSPGNQSDDYRFILNSSGMRIVRSSKNQQESYTLAQLRRHAVQFPDNSVQVAIHVMRSQQRLALWIDGSEEARIADPIENIPTGNTITLLCGNPSGTRQSISGLGITEYNDSHARQLAEDRGDPDSDVLITRDEDRWTGKVLDITDSDNGTFIHFKTDFADQPLEIELSEISTLRFANTITPTRHHGMTSIELRSNRLLHATTCTLADGRITAIHPLLGTLTIDKSQVSSISRIPAKPDPQQPE